MSPRRAAFTALYRAHAPVVLGYLRRRVADEAVAEELAAEVFQVAWQKLDPDDAFERAWLLAVAKNKLHAHYRRQVRRGAAESALLTAAEAQQARLAVDDRLALESAIGALSERDREMIRLTYWEQLSAAEVAEVLGCRPGAVWTALTRARSRLAAALTDTTGGER